MGLTWRSCEKKYSKLVLGNVGLEECNACCRKSIPVQKILLDIINELNKMIQSLRDVIPWVARNPCFLEP